MPLIDVKLNLTKGASNLRLVVFLFGLGLGPSLKCWMCELQLEKAFSVCRTGNIWKVKMINTDTEGTFGTLGAAMRCAYLLADGLKDWKADSDGGAA